MEPNPWESALVDLEVKLLFRASVMALAMVAIVATVAMVPQFEVDSKVSKAQDVLLALRSQPTAAALNVVVVDSAI